MQIFAGMTPLHVLFKCYYGAHNKFEIIPNRIYACKMRRCILRTSSQSSCLQRYLLYRVMGVGSGEKCEYPFSSHTVYIYYYFQWVSTPRSIFVRMSICIQRKYTKIFKHLVNEDRQSSSKLSTRSKIHAHCKNACRFSKPMQTLKAHIRFFRMHAYF